MPLPTDEALRKSLNKLKETYERDKKRFDEQEALKEWTIDPLLPLAHCVLKPCTTEDWFASEKLRRLDKGLTNAIGIFHEDVLKSLEGWHKPTRGFDLRNDDRKIVAEVKNKHNTMNSSSADRIYGDMYHFIRQHPDWISYLVMIVPKNGGMDTEWKISGRETCEQIRKIDGASFYDLATGEADALNSIYHSLYRFLKIEGNLEALIEELFEYAYGRSE